MDEEIETEQQVATLLRYPLTDAQKNDLNNRFLYHAPHGDQAERYVKIRDRGHMLATTILNLTPASREQSLALTNLEQAVFWANAAIARNEKPQKENS